MKPSGCNVDFRQNRDIWRRARWYAMLPSPNPSTLQPFHLKELGSHANGEGWKYCGEDNSYFYVFCESCLVKQGFLW